MEALTCTNKEIMPELKGVLKQIDDDKIKRESLIKQGLNDFHFLIGENTLFRLGYLGEKIKSYTTDTKANLIADLMLVNSYFYSPFMKTKDNLYQI